MMTGAAVQSALHGAIRVLVVEDNPTDVLLLEDVLTNEPAPLFGVTVAGSLGECMRRLQAQEFDVVLLDLTLPDSNGLHTLREVRGAFPQVPVVVMTGLENEGLGLRAMEAGAQDYLQKGYVQTPLLGAFIRYALERHQRQASIQAADQRETQRREIQSFERLSEPPDTHVSAGIYAGLSLREESPAEFSRMVDWYREVLHLAFEQRIYKTANATSSALREIAQQAGYRRGGPRDVVEIHTEALKSAIASMPLEKSRAYIEEGRLLVLELMGYLAAYYRSYYTGQAR
jgi:DNA-binding response OmpR family regulator